MELCKSCHAGCCRRYNPVIWGSDIIRICEALNVDIFFILSVIKVDKEKAKQLENIEPIFIFTDTGEELYFELTLKYEESKYFPGSSKCMFLREWNAKELGSEELSGIISRCSIYSIRPINCRAWPVGYDAQRDQVILKDPHLVFEKEHKRVNESPAYSLCSRELKHEDYMMNEETMAQNAIINHYEMEFFIKLAHKWNQNPDVSDNFYKFLVKEYNNRIEYIKGEAVNGAM
ncbi:MAG: hypothetical protein A2Y25_01485 [Candidatus Melainabacteria bacterium GWF2_37_15]|nr:MAG: hypothetical protein A2Y25_01485 [Candidatus Melainabacteria bacterium GWF2_37_15]